MDVRVQALAFKPFEWNFFAELRDPRLNVSLWTIPFEMAFYAAFALIAAVLRKWWPILLAVACGPLFIWWEFGAATFDPSNAPLAVQLVFLGEFFAFGAMLRGLPALRSRGVSALLVAAGAVACASGSPVIGLALLIPTIVIYVGVRTWLVLNQAGRLGDFSYGIYLWAWPIQQVIATCLSPSASVWQLLLASTVTVVPVAVLSWHLVEKRALAAKPGSGAVWSRVLTLELR